MGRLVVVSNRVVVPNRNTIGSAGGLSVVVRPILKRYGGIWFGWSGRIATDPEVRAIKRGHQSYILMDLTRADHDEYYSGFANRVLWPIFHYRLDNVEFSRRELDGYLRVNQRFASELHKILVADDIIWVHDYHLLPLAEALRRLGHQNRIGFFHHVPFPPPDVLTAIPYHERLIPAICHYDLIGFQTDRDASNFSHYLEDQSALTRQSRQLEFQVPTGVFPVGVETAELNRLARRAVHSDFVQDVVQSLAGRNMIIGVDRLDYSKGIALRMEAFDRFLTSNRDWHGKVTYLQITPKSRSDIPDYAHMEREIDETAGRINGMYGEASWTPIRYVNRNHSRTALAGLYRSARAALVTPLRDGMNLVAKEYVACQDPEDPGVLILSRFAGAAAECAAALLVNPHDPETVGTAIAEALSMPLDERRARHRALYQVLLVHDARNWSDRFLDVLTRPDRHPDCVPSITVKNLETARGAGLQTETAAVHAEVR